MTMPHKYIELLNEAKKIEKLKHIEAYPKPLNNNFPLLCRQQSSQFLNIEHGNLMG